jgi:hypothetical protein
MPRAAGAHNRGQRLLGGPLRGQESGLRRQLLPRHGAQEQRHDGGAAVAAAPLLCSTRAARPRRSVHLQITCETGPADFPASLSVAVVDGSDVATFCCFAYTREYTPSKRNSSITLRHSSITLRRRRPVGRTARLHLTCTARRRPPARRSAAVCVPNRRAARQQPGALRLRQLDAAVAVQLAAGRRRPGRLRGIGAVRRLPVPHVRR